MNTAALRSMICMTMFRLSLRFLMPRPLSGLNDNDRVGA